jgi:hypothetical protein
MSNGIHTLVLYVNETEKAFSVTARMDRARLSGVDEQMSQPGWTRKLVADRLEKKVANSRKAQLRAEWETRGFTYLTRPQLS